ncbi:MAG TPA: serine acetyltransferase [Phycisphaeraceae bacterium]
MTTSGTSPRTPPPLEKGDRNLNPPGMSLLALIAEDWRTHDRRWLAQGFWVLALHRFGNWRMSIRPKLLRAPFSLLYKMLYPFTEWVCGIKLSYNVQVGRRVRIEHFGGMILGARSIGDDVIIRQNTTFGVARTGHNTGKPIIEDRVDIGCGVAILGDVRIGHDSIIGANAVVVRDVPPCSIVVGVPGRVIRTRSAQEIAQSLAQRGLPTPEPIAAQLATQTPAPQPAPSSAPPLPQESRQS